jgi:hypothetical protein
MPTVVTVINTHTDKHYAIKIPPVEKGIVKTNSIYLLSFSKEKQEIIETFVEKYEAAEDATVSDILEKGKEIVNSYRH